LLGVQEIHLPRTKEEFYLWAFLLVVFYVVSSLAVRHARGKRYFEVAALTMDAATFSVSVLLLIGVTIDHQVLVLMGDTTWFLIIAGMVGVLYSVSVPFRSK
jgi:hypothetical protein